jgi:ATP-dependent Zn protease
MSDDMIDGFERKQIVATHEAGHAVICYVLGYDFVLLTIEPNETLGSDGAFQRSPLKEARENSTLTEAGKKHWMLDKIKMTLSGGLAVYQLTNNIKALGMNPDLNSAWGLARMLLKDEEKATELNTALASQVGDLIRNKRNWVAITALAKELIKSKTLDYEKAVNIIEKAFNDFDLGKA